MTAHFILYVRDQPRSEAFYSEVLAMRPRLSVPGMTSRTCRVAACSG